jgi:hypothetical protein
MQKHKAGGPEPNDVQNEGHLPANRRRSLNHTFWRALVAMMMANAALSIC